MDQPSDIRDLSARRPGSASVIELRSPSQLRPDLRDAIEPIQRKFGRPELVIREHTNNTVRWKQGERLNHLLEEACIRFSESDAVVTDGVTLSYRELDCRANQVANGLRAINLTPATRVAVLAKNTDAFYEVLFGAAKACQVLVPVNF